MPIEIKRFSVPGREHSRMYCSKTELTRVPCGGERGAQYIADDMPSFLAALLDIPGVAIAEVHAYHAIITKSAAHEWEEIEPSLLNLFSAFQVVEGRAATQIDNPEINYVYDTNGRVRRKAGPRLRSLYGRREEKG